MDPPSTDDLRRWGALLTNSLSFEIHAGETGFDVKVLGFAGVIAYEIPEGTKLVYFWNMVPITDSGNRLDESEVIEIVWLHPQPAQNRLKYPLERAIVSAWQDFEIPSGDGGLSKTSPTKT